MLIDCFSSHPIQDPSPIPIVVGPMLAQLLVSNVAVNKGKIAIFTFSFMACHYTFHRLNFIVPISAFKSICRMSPSTKYLAAALRFRI
jgi:hypothetical protein